MKKIIISLFLIVLFVTGCSLGEAEHDVNTIFYSLDISNYYKENITFTFPSNAYELAVNSMDSDYDSLEYILLIDNFSRPIHNNVYTYYGKNINQFKKAVEAQLDFNYLEKDFVNSNYINTCFEKPSIKDEDDYLEIDLKGAFYCLQDKTMVIEVSSIYPDQYSNGTYIDGKTQWVIDKYNKDNVDIYYKVMRNKKSMATSYGLLQKHIDHDTLAIIEFFIIVGVLIVGFFFYKFLYNRQFHE